MEWTVLLTGPEGAGKPQAVSSVFDIATVDTEVAETAQIAQLKACIAMAVDADRVELGVAGTGKLSLLGSLRGFRGQVQVLQLFLFGLPFLKAFSA